MQKRLDFFTAQLEIIRPFVAKYRDRIPETFGTLSMGAGYESNPMPGLYVHLSEGAHDYCQTNREKALSLAGEVFGTDDWISTMNRDRTGYDWTTVRHGVKITISNAALITEPRVSFPVPANAFPIMLQDTAPATPSAE